MSKTSAERKSSERKRKREAGLVPKEVWIKKGRDQDLAKAVEKINKG